MLNHFSCRVSVVIIQEELDEWQEEIDKLKEVMSAANDEGLPPDFIGQMQDFIPVSLNFVWSEKSGLV